MTKDPDQTLAGSPRLSGYLDKWLAALEANGGKFSRSEEEAAFAVIMSEIESENHPAIRLFMEDLLLSSCADAQVLPSVLYKFNWKESVKQERALSLKFPTDLYVEIERLLSRHIGSRYAPDGVVRYPLTIPKNRPGQRKRMNVDSATTSPSKILGAHYKSGSNKYYVGKAIESLIEFLEQRYGLHIADLEAEFQQRKASSKKSAF
jgi:hypothetical protein